MIQAMLTGEPFEAPVNIPNSGQGVGLPPDAVLESICVIDGDGIRGRDRAALPTPYDEIVRRHVATQELTVEAALRGDRTSGGGGLRARPAGRPGRPARHGGHGRRAARPARRSGCPSSPSRARDVGREHACASDSSGSAPWGCRWRGISWPPATTSPSPRGAGGRSTPPWHRGAADGGSPRGVAEASEVVILCVPNSPEVVEVVDAMLPVLGAGQDGRRLLDHRPRGGAGPARPGRRDRGALPRRAAVGRHGRARRRARSTLMVGGDADVLADTSRRWSRSPG